MSFRVLAVDDDIDFLESLVERLTIRGLEARGVDNGEDAVVQMNRAPADVVILDVRLPGIDGIETLKQIKQNHPLAEVMILTAYADTKTAVKVMELGAFDYLVKPVEFDELLYRLTDAHQKKVLQEQKVRNSSTAATPNAQKKK